MTLRTTLLSARQGLSPAEKQRADAQLSRKIIAWCEANPVTSLGVYLPIRGEPDLDAAYRQLSAAGITLALPVVRHKNQPLVFIAWQPDDPVTTGAYGTTIPQATTEIAPAALLLPCVGFSVQRFRLGYGGGFYDRTLGTTPRPQTIGVAYDCTEAVFDSEAHDIALDSVITETRVFQA
jgi:5-formyltetrahydrofolate cyclo-ligase